MAREGRRREGAHSALVARTAGGQGGSQSASDGARRLGGRPSRFGCGARKLARSTRLCIGGGGNVRTLNAAGAKSRRPPVGRTGGRVVPTSTAGRGAVTSSPPAPVAVAVRWDRTWRLRFRA